MFLALLLCRMKGGIPVANRFLAGFVATVSLSIGLSVFLPHWRLHELLQFLFAPLLYLFVRTLLWSRREGFVRWLPHFLPVILYPVVFVLSLVLNIPDPKGTFFHIAFELVTSLHMWIYLLVSFLSVVSTIRNREAPPAVRRNAFFAVSFLSGTALVYSAFLVILAVLIIGGYDFQRFSRAVGLTGAVSLYFVSYLFLANSGSIGLPAAAKYRKSTLSEGDKERGWAKIVAAFETDRFYLDPDLTQIELSRRLEIPRQYLSQIIGEKGKGTFNDLVNRYRLDEFLDRVNRGDLKRFNLLAVALDSGFNSKNAFLSAFRKTYGMTPSDYLKNR